MATTTDDHHRWLAARLRETSTVKAGTRVGELLAVFREDGGLQSVPARVFVLRSCPLVKIDVELEDAASGRDGDTLEPTRRIAHVSRPYLALPVMD